MRDSVLILMPNGISQPCLWATVAAGCGGDCDAYLHLFDVSGGGLKRSSTPCVTVPGIRSSLPPSLSPATSQTAAGRAAEGDWNGVAPMIPIFSCVIPLCHRVS